MHSKYLSLLNFRLEIFENQSATVLMGYRASKKKKKMLKISKKNCKWRIFDVVHKIGSQKTLRIT